MGGTIAVAHAWFPVASRLVLLRQQCSVDLGETKIFGLGPTIRPESPRIQDTREHGVDSPDKLLQCIRERTQECFRQEGDVPSEIVSHQNRRGATGFQETRLICESPDHLLPFDILVGLWLGIPVVKISESNLGLGEFAGNYWVAQIIPDYEVEDIP